MVTVAYGRSGQRLICPHLGEVPPATGLTVEILDSAGGSKIGPATGTVSAFSGTTTSIAYAGQRQVACSGTGLTVGDPVRLDDPGGHHETAIVASVASGLLTLRDDLARDYASGTTLRSLLAYYDLDASNTATWPIAAYYQAIWDAPSWLRPRADLLRIVDLAAEGPATFEDLRRWLPDLAALRDGYDDADLADLRASSWVIVSARIAAAGKDPAVLRDSAELANPCALLAAALFLIARGHYDRAKQLAGDPVGSGGLFGQLLNDVLRSPLWFDDDQDRAVAANERRSVPLMLGRSL